MSEIINLSKNRRIVKEWQPLLSTEDLGNDPVLKLDLDEKERELSDAAFFHDIDKTPDLLDASAEASTFKDIDKTSVAPTPKCSVKKKIYRDPKDDFSSPENTILLELLSKSPDDVDFEQSKCLLLTPAQPLRRSSRASTQKKTRETDERLKLKSSSSAVSKTNGITKTHFPSPDYESLMADSALSNSLSAKGLFDTKDAFPLITTSLIATPNTVTSSSLDPFQLVPGLDEWNHLYLCRPRMGAQFAIWEWLDSVRSTAFRYPASVVKREKSRLDSWTKAAINSSVCDMSVSFADIYIGDVDDDMASFIGNILNEEESPREVGEKTSGLQAGAKSFFPRGELIVGKKKCPLEDMVKHVAPDASGKENALMTSTPTELKAFENIVPRERVVSFKPVLSPKSGNATNTTYRKTPHFKVCQPTPNKTLSTFSHFSGYPSVPRTAHCLKAPYEKPHYPTTPFVCDSPSTDIPECWVSLFLNRPDPFESSTQEVLAWLGDVSSMIEVSSDNIPATAVSSMPSISSLNDTPMTCKLDAMSPMCSPMSTSFTSPYFKPKDT